MTRTTTPETNKIQELIDALNTIDGIEFAEDAWKQKAPSNYGVVMLTGEIANDYADGVKIAQGFGVTINMYVTGNSYHWITAVQDVLNGLRIRYTLESREFIETMKKVRWTWNARIRQPIVKEVAGNG